MERVKELNIPGTFLSIMSDGRTIFKAITQQLDMLVPYYNTNTENAVVQPL